jgi:hypothetical protein
LSHYLDAVGSEGRVVENTERFNRVLNGKEGSSLGRERISHIPGGFVVKVLKKFKCGRYIGG